MGANEEDPRPLEHDGSDDDVAAQVFELAARTNVNVVLRCAINGLIERGLSLEQVLIVCRDAYDRQRSPRAT
jgi:hypothetical protein